MQTQQIVRSRTRFVFYTKISPLRKLDSIAKNTIAGNIEKHDVDYRQQRAFELHQHRRTIELRYLYTYYRALSSHSISYFNGALDAACLGAVAGNNEICLPDFYLLLSLSLCRCLFPPTSSITFALPSSAGSASCKSHPHLFSPRTTTLGRRRVFTRYVNGTSSDER